MGKYANHGVCLFYTRANGALGNLHLNRTDIRLQDLQPERLPVADSRHRDAPARKGGTSY